jgi:aminomethyltransferase
VGLSALERVPVREHTELQDDSGRAVGEVTSGLLGPSVNRPIAMAYLPPGLAGVGTRVNAIVRGKAVPMQVSSLPFVPHRYRRG